ncbi:hypothetical protein A4E84_39755 [Streptomyces qaidamensis]|uniref:Uncharacterized protein n=1 Tax=Streptomyces qaidamensis TaxID=1783515 RepID=A0A143CCC7_9ACTN|nr:hypothetical protein A4E84_39755 [Streptomyces qaidamensis]
MSKVVVVDRVTERLRKAEEISAVPIDFAEGNPVERIRSASRRRARVRPKASTPWATRHTRTARIARSRRPY